MPKEPQKAELPDGKYNIVLTIPGWLKNQILEHCASIESSINDQPHPDNRRPNTRLGNRRKTLTTLRQNRLPTRMAATTKHEVLFRMRDSGNLIGVFVWVFYWWGFCVVPE
jgi:hypothetical protein